MVGESGPDSAGGTQSAGRVVSLRPRIHQFAERDIYLLEWTIRAMSCRISHRAVLCSCTKRKPDAMKLIPLCRHAVFAAVLMQTVLEVANAQEPRWNRRAQNEQLVPERRTAENAGRVTSQPDGVDGTGNPALGRERRPLYRFTRSDLLEINFAFTPEFNQSVSVQPDGFISLKEVGHIVAEGRTAPELEQAIAEAYGRTLHDPEVTVVLKDFEHPYFIASGEVGHPGKYELRGETTVSGAVAIAGGFTQQSKHSQVVLFRRVSADLVESHVLNVKQMLKQRSLDEDPYLQPGDYIFVPRSLISKIMRFMPATSLGMYSSAAQF